MMAPLARALLVVFLLTSTLSACGEGTPTRGDVREKRINDPVRRESVSERVGNLHLQTVRIEMPVGEAHAAGGNSALFLTIANNGAAEDRLVAVSSVDATSIIERNGAEDPASGIDITVPERGAVSMQHADGLHLELVGLKQDVAKRSFVPVTFRFEDAGAVSFKVFVSGVDHPVVAPLPTPDGAG